MQSGNDYAELCDLGPSRWSSTSRNYHIPHTSLHHGVTSASTSHIRSNSFEAEDLIEPYVNSRINSSTNSLRAGGSGVSGSRTGLYYSPPGTSYTIVERPHSPHYYYNTAGGNSGSGGPTKTGSLPNRGIYLGTSSTAHLSSQTNVSGSNNLNSNSNTITSSTTRQNLNKKRPISPEQVLRLFGTTTSSSSAPSNYSNYSNGSISGYGRDRGRRSPSSSPPSTTHQVNKVSKMFCVCD